MSENNEKPKASIGSIKSLAVKEVVNAVKLRIAFIDHPNEPMNSAGPDWSNEVKLMDALQELADEGCTLPDTLDKFQAMTDKLMVTHHHPIDPTIEHSIDGICSEAGELADAAKRVKWYGTELDKVNTLEECGDIIFYLDKLIRACGSTWDEVIQMNMRKLSKRYKNHEFTKEQAVNRDTDAERVILEAGVKDKNNDIIDLNALGLCSTCQGVCKSNSILTACGSYKKYESRTKHELVETIMHDDGPITNPTLACIDCLLPIERRCFSKGGSICRKFRAKSISEVVHPSRDVDKSAATEGTAVVVAHTLISKAKCKTCKSMGVTCFYSRPDDDICDDGFVSKERPEDFSDEEGR